MGEEPELFKAMNLVKFHIEQLEDIQARTALLSSIARVYNLMAQELIAGRAAIKELTIRG